MRRNPRASVLLGVVLALTVTAVGQNPVPKPPTVSATTNLARCIPKAGLFAYVEYHGIEAHKEAWTKTAANKILNDTATGAMIEDLVRQFLDAQLAQVSPAARPASGSELTAVFKHIATHGVVYASNFRTRTQHPATTIVFPAALRDEASKKTFGPMVRLLTTGSKTEPFVKPGGRSIIKVTPNGTTGPGLFFWKEKNSDLIIADDPDAVIAALDGKSPSAADNPIRKDLFAAESGAEAIGGAMFDVSSVPAGPSQMANFFTQAGIDPKSIKRLEYRLGFRGSDLTHEIRLVTPSPRVGVLAMLDGPKFDVKLLPPIPDSMIEFGAMSIDPAKLFGQLAAMAKASGADTNHAFSSIEATVKAKTKMRLREDILGRFGPRLIVYKMPTKTKTEPRAGGLLGMLGSGGLQVPRSAMLVEIKDAKAVASMLDQLMLVANKELKTRIVAAPPTEAGERPKTASKAEVPEIKVTLNNPKTYSLNLPPSLGAMTNLRLTVVVGKKYLVIATMPDVAKEAITAESKGTSAGGKGLAAEAAKVVQGMPTGMMILTVTDPRSTLPEGLANLPTSLAAALPPPGPPAPGAAPPGGPITFQIDPLKIPNAEAIRPLVGLSATAFATDDQSIRFLVRHSFPDIGGWIALPATFRALREGPRMPNGPGNAPVHPANDAKKPPGGGGVQIN